MSVGIKVKVFEAGHCVHPGFMVKPGLGLAPRKFPAGAVLIDHPTAGYLLFDTGYHERFKECTRHFPERLYALATPCHLQSGQSLKEQLVKDNIAACDIQHVLLSHFHGDHIAGVCDYPDAIIHCHSSGYRFLTTGSRFGRIRKGYLKDLLPDSSQVVFEDRFPLDVGQVLELPDTTIGLGAKDLFGDGLLFLVALPGHAAGQMGLLVRRQHGFLFFLADACWLIDNLKQGVDPHWLTRLVSDDHNAYYQTLTKLRRCYRLAADKVTFAPSHCEDTWRHLQQQDWIV